MSRPAKQLVAYCGLYCGDCPGYTGRIADLARDLRKELRAVKFARSAEMLAELPAFKRMENYQECYDILGLMVKLRCRRTCLARSRAPQCPVFVCCREKEYEGCWEYEEFETCAKMEFLKRNHGDANLKNLRRIRRRGMREFLAGRKYW